MYLSYRNQSIGLQSKSENWFLYDRGLRHERVKLSLIVLSFLVDTSDKKRKIENSFPFTSYENKLSKVLKSIKR